MTDTVPLGDRPRLTATRTAQHFKQLIEQGIPHDLALALTDRYHERVMDQVFGEKQEQCPTIGFTDAYSSDMVEEEDD